MNGNIYQNMPPYQFGIVQSRANRNMSEFRDTLLREYGLSSPGWFMLGYVASKTGQGGTRVGDIAVVLDVQSTYVTGMLRKLEAKKLVQSQVDKEDRRGRIVTVTKKGSAVAAAIDKEFMKQSETWLAQISPAAMRQYLTVLAVLAQGYPGA